MGRKAKRRVAVRLSRRVVGDVARSGYYSLCDAIRQLSRFPMDSSGSTTDSVISGGIREDTLRVREVIRASAGGERRE